MSDHNSKFRNLSILMKYPEINRSVIEKIYNDYILPNPDDITGYTIVDNDLSLNRADDKVYTKGEAVRFFANLYTKNKDFDTYLINLEPNRPLINSELINEEFIKFYLNYKIDKLEILAFFENNITVLANEGFDYTRIEFNINNNTNCFVFYNNESIYDNDDLISIFKKLYDSKNDTFKLHLNSYLRMYYPNHVLPKKTQDGGRKTTYKSTKKKVSVIIKKKTLFRTIYKNSKGINYIRVNNEYKLLSKFKIS